MWGVHWRDAIIGSSTVAAANWRRCDQWGVNNLPGGYIHYTQTTMSFSLCFDAQSILSRSKCKPFITKGGAPKQFQKDYASQFLSLKKNFIDLSFFKSYWSCGRHIGTHCRSAQNTWNANAACVIYVFSFERILMSWASCFLTRSCGRACCACAANLRCWISSRKPSLKIGGYFSKRNMKKILHHTIDWDEKSWVGFGGK